MVLSGDTNHRAPKGKEPNDDVRHPSAHARPSVRRRPVLLLLRLLAGLAMVAVINAPPRPAHAEAATVPLKLFWSAARGNNFTTATTLGEQSALAAGYVYVRVEGYVYPTQQPGMTALRLWYSDARGDNFTTATAAGDQAAKAAGYRYARVEGYLPASGSPPGCDLRGVWRNNLNFGVWTILDHGAAGASGTYTWSGGGSASGRFDQETLHTTRTLRLRASWHDKNGAGWWDITFDRDCRTFSGHWGFGTGPPPREAWYGWKQ